MRLALGLIVAAFAVPLLGADAEIVRPTLQPPPWPVGLVYLTDTTAARPVLWGANADGSSPVRLGMGAADIMLSPDGRTVAIVTPESEDGASLVVTPAVAPGRARTLLHASNFLVLRAWSPDATKVAVVVNDQPDDPGGEPRVPDSRLVLVDVRTGAKTVVAHGGIGGVSFSPSGRRLVYAHAPQDNVAFCADLFMANVNGSHVRALTHDARSGDPLWGPKRIAFSRARGCSAVPDIHLPSQLWTLRPDGRGARQLTHVRFRPLSSGLTPTAWSDDGRRLLAEQVAGGNATSDAWTVEVPDGRARDLTGKIDNVIGTGLSHDGQAVLVQSGPLDDPDRDSIATIPWRGGHARVLVVHGSSPSWNR
jgi:dipeptidyl aminopeptidase/acylaminoacyl peptidase